MKESNLDQLINGNVDIETLNAFLRASKHPLEDISKIAYVGQNPKMMQHMAGYENYFNQMPVLDSNDPFLTEKVALSGSIMKHLAKELSGHSWIHDEVNANSFERFILALEKPISTPLGYQEGAEFVVAKWGDQYTSPVHGHAPGYEHEEILTGKMRVNHYRMVSPNSNVVRPSMTEVVERGTFISEYTKPNAANTFKRQALIHNFVSIGYSASLHYLAEHTRDGRDNGFEVEHFTDAFPLSYPHVSRITAQEGYISRIGDVILVRSTNVPEYGDHYIVITGHVIKKAHGMRPQDIAIQAPNSRLLNLYPDSEKLILLRLNATAKAAFYDFHGITIENGEVKFA